MVQSDKGTEFLNSTFQSMLRRHGVRFYTSENEDLKAAVVERFNRTLKTKMFRTAIRDDTWTRCPICCIYNDTYHRSIAMTPAAVNVDNEDLVRAETEDVQMEVRRRRQSAYRHAASAVAHRILGRLIRGNFQNQNSPADDAGDVRTQSSGRRTYKRQVLRAGNSEGAKIRRRTFRHRSNIKDQKT